MIEVPPFYPRTPNCPLISILFPTRGRVYDLRAAVDSCYSLAKDKSHLEFIFKVDTDDLPSIECVQQMKDMGLPCKIMISDRGSGYHDMHLWVNEMTLKYATGDWITVLNDDARMLTQNWDEYLYRLVPPSPWIGCESFTLCIMPTEGRPFANEFYLLRRATAVFLGHVSLSPHTDTWIYSVMKFLDMQLTSGNIGIRHLSDVMKDEIRRSTVEAYKSTILTYNSMEARRKRLLDVTNIAVRLEHYSQTLEWEDKPARSGWYVYQEDVSLPYRAAFVHPDLAHTLVVRSANEPATTEKIEKGKWLLVNPATSN